MPEITFILADGSERGLEAPDGVSVMAATASLTCRHRALRESAPCEAGGTATRVQRGGRR